MREISKTFSYKWMQEVWNQGRRESIDELLNTDIVAHGLNQVPMFGIEDFKKYYDEFQKNFTNIFITVRDVISEDDMESVNCNVKATHIESGKEVNFSGQCMLRIRDGKISEAWNNFDFFGMYSQLGYTLKQEIYLGDQMGKSH
jgi:ketosteroid isomerase-like protein